MIEVDLQGESLKDFEEARQVLYFFFTEMGLIPFETLGNDGAFTMRIKFDSVDEAMTIVRELEAKDYHPVRIEDTTGKDYDPFNLKGG